MFWKIVLFFFFFEICRWHHLHAQALSCVRLFATPWAVAHPALLPLGFTLHHKHQRRYANISAWDWNPGRNTDKISKIWQESAGDATRWEGTLHGEHHSGITSFKHEFQILTRHSDILPMQKETDSPCLTELSASRGNSHRFLVVPVKGTWVWSLVQEDCTCFGATRKVQNNWWPSLRAATTEAWVSQSPGLFFLSKERSRHKEKPASSTNSSPCSRQLGKQSQQWRPCAAKKKKSY